MIRKSNDRTNQIKVKYITARAISVMVVGLGAISDASASDADYSFVVSPDWHNCQQINSDYQEVYAFETASFYVNICQKDNLYFYSGEAKQSEKADTQSLHNSIFIPALPLENNQGFQAENGNVSYIVVLPFSEQTNPQSLSNQPAEAILTIKRNDQLVSVESSLNKYCDQSDEIAIDNIKLNPQSSNQLATIPQQQDLGWDLSLDQPKILPTEIFNSDSRFDFYRIDGKIHRLTTCN